MNRQSMEQASARMKELVGVLEKADVAYYKYDAPIMSDREYDILWNELKVLEDETGIQLSGSPTQKVSGAVLEELKPVRHETQMLSADKTKQISDLVSFAQRNPVLLSWKLDGLTLVLTYENGELKTAATRGTEGLVGEDVTHTVKMMSNVPLRVPDKRKFTVRGEGLISWKQFDEINATLDEPYAHPRNLAAGTVRKLDASSVKERKPVFFAFELVEELGMSTKHEQLEFLRRSGFSVVPYQYIDAAATYEKVNECVAVYDPKKYEYPVDGLIMEYDSIAYGRSLGATGHHSHRMIALKWQDELFETTFRGIRLATTRTGMVSLTAYFDTVIIDNTEVSNAYVHNLDIYENLKLGVGDRIKVYKANLIIPQIAENITCSGDYKISMNCPCCGSRLAVETTAGGTRQLFCRNIHCTAKMVQKFEHFCSKGRMDIDGLSEQTLEKFIQNGWIRNFADLYHLDRFKDEIIKTEGFGEKSFANLQKAVDESRYCSLGNFLAALSIPLIGRTAGKQIAQYFGGGWERFESALRNGFDFTQLNDFGKAKHDSLHDWYRNEEEQKLCAGLLDEVIFEVVANNPDEESLSKTVFYGKTVVVTGKLRNYTRDSIQLKLQELGAKGGSNISKSTDYLLAGEKAGSKLAKAQKFGVCVITEEEFEELARIVTLRIEDDEHSRIDMYAASEQEQSSHVLSEDTADIESMDSFFEMFFGAK